ncbi:MAG: serine/threonine-protein kinase [Sandaracinaceae bacterium]
MGARTDRRFQSADTIAALPRPEGFADDWLGQVLDGRYEIQQFLAEGGTGLVFRGVHQTLGRPVAIKVLRKEYSQLAEALERFRREARAATAVGNPHIVTIYDFGRLEGRQAYVVMELLDGVELAAILERQPQVPWTRAVDIVLQLTEGMAAAHAAGIIHRDLKPENVVLVRDPETGAPSSFVKILDFGVAKFQGAQVRLTGAGRMVGTPEYMAPEQCTGGAVDVRTDIYALGVMLYEMLMGRLPFAGGTLEECVRQHLQDPPPAFRKVGPDIEVPSGLEKVVRRCLAKAQDDRFGSMGELAAALAPFLERDTTAIPLSSRRPTVKAARMSRRWALGARAAGVLGGLVAGWARVGEALVDRALT